MPSNIVAYEWPLNATGHIAYETDDTHIHEIVVGQHRQWRDNDITVNGPESSRLSKRGMNGPTFRGVTAPSGGR